MAVSDTFGVFIPINRELELALRGIAGDVMLFLDRNICRREHQVGVKCMRCGAFRQLSAIGDDAMYVLQPLVRDDAPSLERTVRLAYDQAGRRRALDVAAVLIAQELADDACSCVRDGLALRGGPRPRRWQKTEGMMLATTGELSCTTKVTLKSPYADEPRVRMTDDGGYEMRVRMYPEIPFPPSKQEQIAMVNRHLKDELVAVDFVTVDWGKD